MKRFFSALGLAAALSAPCVTQAIELTVDAPWQTITFFGPGDSGVDIGDPADQSPFTFDLDEEKEFGLTDTGATGDVFTANITRDQPFVVLPVFYPSAAACIFTSPAQTIIKCTTALATPGEYVQFTPFAPLDQESGSHAAANFAWSGYKGPNDPPEDPPPAFDKLKLLLPSGAYSVEVLLDDTPSSGPPYFLQGAIIVSSDITLIIAEPTTIGLMALPLVLLAAGKRTGAASARRSGNR